ncbi:MAG TPA: ABC transporter permease [Vicinamibacterales bacterium]|nr:ABC transporter permease [Vicinamibacterales bacterium]
MLSQDLRFAWRSLRRQPAFTAVAVLTLALGLGANTAMFSVISAVLLRPLPYPSPERLVKLVGLDTATGEQGNLSPADFIDFARATRTMDRVGAHGYVGFFTIADRTGLPERIGGVIVTEGFFPTLGALFALGRPFLAEEDLPNGPRAVILSHGFWQRRYGGDPTIIGRSIDVNARPATVVGVLSPDYRHVEANPERDADAFMAFQFEPAGANRGGHFIRGVGRLKPDYSIEQARADWTAIARRLEEQYPADNTDRGVVLSDLHVALVADTRPALLLLAAAVGFVLLVACANLANLLLAQGASRRTELAVRASMGAGRGRLVRQLLTESLLLAGLGGAAGIALAVASTRALTWLGAAGVPRAEDIRVDPWVLTFAMALAALTGIFSGLLPALQISRGDLHGAVREGSRGQARPALHRPMREVLIASQVALALVLLAGAGLMVRSLWQLLHVDTGFASEQVLTFETAVPTATYAEGDQIPFYEQFYDALRRQPGVTAVGAINILPLSANFDSRGVQIDARLQPPGQGHSIQARSINADYFQAMHIPLLRGRLFNSRDRDRNPLVVIISESMARRYWPNQDAIGQRLTFNSGIPRELQQNAGGAGSREVVGIVGDVKHLGLDEAEVPMFYTPQAQQPSYHTMAIVVRAAGEPTTLTSAIRGELAGLDRTVPMYRVRTLDTVVRSTVAGPEMRAWLFAVFGVLALIVSVIGVYGVVGYLVSQRTQEIGIRLALGAARGHVLRGLLVEGLRPVALGMAGGLLISLVASRLLAQMLFGVQPTDVLTYVSVVVLLAIAALIATWLPARRVMAVEPMSALR